MELDINKSWTTFNADSATTPGDSSSVHGVKLLPEQSKGPDRYLSTDARDFIAVLTRTPSTPGPAAPSAAAPPAPRSASPSTTAPHSTSRSPQTKKR